MARLLTIQRSTVPIGEREKYFERVKARKAHYALSGCKFWVFEETSLPGAFIEFTESEDENSLNKAHATSPTRVFDPTRVYKEVELD
jgi:hypothetical protein